MNPTSGEHKNKEGDKSLTHPRVPLQCVDPGHNSLRDLLGWALH